MVKLVRRAAGRIDEGEQVWRADGRQIPRPLTLVFAQNYTILVRNNREHFAMSTLHFVALVTGRQGAGYHAAFPDIPGVTAEGGNVADLLVNARGMLLDHLQALADAAEPWPAATPMEQVAVAPGAVAMLVDVAIDDPPIRVNVSLGERLVQRMDAAAERAA